MKAYRKSIVPLFCLLLAVVVACGSDGTYMRQQLAELQDKNLADSVLTDTTLAETLATYFDDHGTQNERLEAHYLLARTWTDVGDAPRALDEFQKAAALADTTSLDSLGGHWLSRIYGQMGELLYQHQLPRNALTAYQKAYQYAKQSKETLVSVIFYEQQGKCYYDLNLEDSVSLIVQKVIDMYLACGDTLRANTIKGPMSYMLVQKGELAKAKDYLNSYEYHSSINEQALQRSDDLKLFYIYKAFLYQGLAQCDSALHYYYKSLSSTEKLNNRILTYRGLYQTYSLLDERDSVSKYSILYGDACNESNKQDISISLLSMQHLYDYNHFKSIAQQKTIEVSRSNMHLVILFFISFAIFTVLIIVLIFLWNRHREFRLRIHAKYTSEILGYIATKEKLQRLESQYAVNEHLVKLAKEDLDLFRESISQTRRQFSDMEGWGMTDYFQKSQIVTTLKSKGRKGLSATDKELHELRRMTSLYLPEFFGTLQSFGYHLQKRDLYICILVKLDFCPSEICTLMQISSQALSNLRKRLLKRLFNIEGSSLLFDEKIQSLSSGESL